MPKKATKTTWDDFSERKPNRNLGLKVDRKTFWVSRESMGDLSPTFMTMFYGEFDEARKDVVELPEKKSAEILELLRCLFRSSGGALKKVDSGNVDILLALADEYEIGHLTKKCRKFLNKEMASVRGEDKILKLFILAARFGFKEIVRATFPAVRKMDVSKIQPYANGFPKEIMEAIAFPPPPQEFKHVMERAPKSARCGTCEFESIKTAADMRCKFCRWLMCDACHESDENICHVCHVCQNKNRRNGAKEESCQCIGDLAFVKLTEVGL